MQAPSRQMDPFSVSTGSIGTLVVLIQSMQALISLVNDVHDALAEVYLTAKHVDLLRFFLDQGHDIDLPAKNGKTALYYSVMSGDIPTMALCLERKANIEVTLKDDTDTCVTPLLQVVFYNKLEAAEFLLKNGANIAAKGEAKYVQTTLINICF